MKSDKTTPNVPTLRFQEFTNPWTLMPLKKLLCFQNGINADSAKYGKGVKFISVSDILNNQYITYDCIKGMIDIDKRQRKDFLSNMVIYFFNAVLRLLKILGVQMFISTKSTRQHSADL